MALAVVVVLVMLAVAAALGLVGGRRGRSAGTRPALTGTDEPRHGEVGAADSMNDRHAERQDEAPRPDGFGSGFQTRGLGTSGAEGGGAVTTEPQGWGTQTSGSMGSADSGTPGAPAPASGGSRFGGLRSGAGPVALAVMFAVVVAVAVDFVNDRQDRKPAKKETAAKAAAGTLGDDTKAGPRFLVAVRRSGEAVSVRNVQTGEEVGLSAAAPQGQRWHQVASAGDGTYVLSAYASGRITFYRLTLAEDGTPRKLAQIPGLVIRGFSTARSDMAVSPDGERVAYVVYGPGVSRIEIAAADTARRRQWTTRSSGQISSLSWAGDTLSFVWTSGRGTAVRRQVRTLDITSANTDLRISKPVLTLPQGGTAAALSGDGGTIVAGVRSSSALSLQEFSTATGKSTKVLWTRKADQAGEIFGLARHVEGGHWLAAGANELVYADPGKGVRGLPAAGYSDVAW